MQTVIWVLRLAAAFWTFQGFRSDAPSLLAVTLVFLLPGALLGGIAQLLETRRRLWLTAFRDRQARELHDRIVAGAAHDEPIFLYLRPFSSTGRLTIDNPNTVATNPAVPGSYEVRQLEAESVLRDALDRFGTLIALGRPGEHYGAGRIATEDERWQATFDLLAQKAALIFLLPSDAPGTWWEIERLRECGYLDKTIIVMPPETSSGFSAAAQWAKARAKLAELGIALPEHQAEGALFPIRDSSAPIVKWMTRKERKLRRELQRAARGTGVELAPRLAAGRRTDAPVLPAIAWMLLFSLMTWYGGGVPWSFELEGTMRASWGLTALAVMLVSFLLLESTYGHFGPKAYALLAILGIVSTSPHELLPAWPFFYATQPWLPLPLLFRGLVIGLLLALLLRSVVAHEFRLSRVALLLVGCLAAASLLDTIAGLTVESWLGMRVLPPMPIVAGLLFGVTLPRAMKLDPWNPLADVKPPLGVEGFVIGWVVVGYALAQLSWGGHRQAWLWMLIGLAGGIAQWFGWYRQGRPIGWGRGIAVVVLWTVAGALVVQLTSWLWRWRYASVMGPYDWMYPLAAEAERQALNGLLFGIAAAVTAIVLRNTARAGAARQILFLAAGFAVFGMAGTYFWVDHYASGSIAAPPFTIFLAAMMACAGYLELRAPRVRAAEAEDA